jgi:hypothetical protein
VPIHAAPAASHWLRPAAGAALHAGRRPVAGLAPAQ